VSLGPPASIHYCATNKFEQLVRSLREVFEFVTACPSADVIGAANFRRGIPSRGTLGGAPSGDVRDRSRLITAAGASTSPFTVRYQRARFTDDSVRRIIRVVDVHQSFPPPPPPLKLNVPKFREHSLLLFGELRSIRNE